LSPEKIKKIDDEFSLQDKKDSYRSKPNLDEIPTREVRPGTSKFKDDMTDEVFASDEFNRMYNEHIRRKEGIR